MRGATGIAISCLIMCSVFSGCLFSSSTSMVDDGSVIDPETESFSIVAPIDTGINVYHNHFIMNESIPDWIIEGMGVTMWCNITKEGTWQERFEADKENCWDIITANDIVYFV